VVDEPSASRAWRVRRPMIRRHGQHVAAGWHVIRIQDDPSEIIFWLSKYMDLRAGDLIYTGTPEGVGPLLRGDVVQAHIDGLSDLHFSIAQDANRTASPA
jgi:fumarylpyruvate hydrolase